MANEVIGLPRGRSLTRDDLDQMPDDGHRYELIDGILIVSPAPRRVHQRAIGNAYIALRSTCPGELEVFLAPFDVVLSEDTVVQPDVLVTRRTDTTERDLPVAPLLAIEVLSPSTRAYDLLLKKDRLQRAGCQHYWVVDPEVPAITAWVLRDGAYVEAAGASGDQEFRVTEPYPISLVPSALIND
ncbi:Uma2 family endonuclease [Aeromicrobium sp. UC242_57]|uniref:Uma2 family endonuclease n=1 Tax=Aeromicrobium sp. UC242_57 TaxID=3374624 RepID=UPI0037AF862C